MVHRSRYIYALGVLFILIAAGHAALKMDSGGPLVEAVLDFLLIGFPGVLLLYVGRWLSSTEFDPALYPRIALWCLGGVGVMLAFIALREVHPGVTVDWTFGTRAIALSMGSIAGLAIGIHEAQSLTRKQEINQRNDELKRTKRPLEERNDELKQTKQRLKERNEELKQTKGKLKETVAEVEASNERLEQFAYAASHDLQEPLRMISKYLQLLENRYSDDLDDDASEFLAFARNGATRMQTLIEDLLQFSQVETQSDPLESVALKSVIDDTRTDLQMRIEESNAEITTDDLPRVEGDPSQLRQLFQNLLSNAMEYSGDESPRIHISAEKRGTEQVISVADEGIGIESDDQERIFEIFQRLHTIDEHAGSGIGLALCQRIVERHGGEIWANSDFGDGATFSFTVPTSEELSAPPEASSHD